MWTTVTPLTQNIYEIKFPSGKLVPFAPINARNDRVYYKRERTNVYHHAKPFYWFALRIQTGDPLPQLRRSFWLIHWAHTHILDHKHLFAPSSLQVQHPKIGYTKNGGADYNNTFTLPPTKVTFPAQVVKNPVHNHWWNFGSHDQCSPGYLHHRIFPHGNSAIDLLKIRPPTRIQELCQQLPDADNPFQSYLHLQNFIHSRTAKNYTWFSWPTRYTNTTQPSINFQKFTSKFFNDTLESEYQAFTTPFTYYFQNLQKARMDETFTTFEINILQHNISDTSDTILTVSDSQDKRQILENNKFSTQQFIHLYARKLWRLHFIRQNILQKHLTL